MMRVTLLTSCRAQNRTAVDARGRQPMSPRLAVEFEWQPAGSVTLQSGMLNFPRVEDTAGIYRFDLSPNGQTQTIYVGSLCVNLQ
jgi:hypothetical protein